MTSPAPANLAPHHLSVGERQQDSVLPPERLPQVRPCAGRRLDRLHQLNSKRPSTRPEIGAPSGRPTSKPAAKRSAKPGRCWSAKDRSSAEPTPAKVKAGR